MGDERETATPGELKEARVDVAWRDYCSHLLIPLNKCREKTMWKPWKCEALRHAYEKCQYDEYMSRMLKMVEQREQERMQG